MASADSILKVLDQSAEAFVFPMLDNGYVYPAAARLSLFRSAADWAVVIETFGYSPRAGWPDLCVATIGSTVRHSRTMTDFVTGEAYHAYLAANPHWTSDFFHPVEDGALLNPADEEMLDGAAKSCCLRGDELPVPTLRDYEAAGVVPSDAPNVRVFEFARAVAHQHRNLVLATEIERIVGLPGPMTCLLTLDDWSHPNLAGSVRPSDELSCRQFAAVLESGDAGRYQATRGNTHWSYRPDGGAL